MTLNTLSEPAEVCEAFVARQPIFDRDLQVVGYELLARASADNSYTHRDGDHATADALSTSLNLLGLKQMTGGTPAFVNFTRGLLLDDYASLLPPEVMVVELLEDVDPDEAVIRACQRLKREGYRLALDDFRQRPNDHRLVELADIIKVDFMATAEAERSRLAEVHLGRRSLLAEKVETAEEFQTAQKLGYEYFQGYFFCQPQVLQARRIDESRVSQLRFLHAVSQPEIDFDELEVIVKQDASLSMKLLRYMNTAVRATRLEIGSIRQALTLLGERALRRWAAMTALVSLSPDKPLELLRTCVLRARFCEVLAEHAEETQHSFTMYLVGLLSAIDAVLDRPLPEILDHLAVPEPVRRTLLEDSGRLSELFRLALAYERGDWSSTDQGCANLQLPRHAVAHAYVEALGWSDHMALAS